MTLLDLSLPKKDGRQVLAEIKSDEKLKILPVVILTTSSAEKKILRSLNLGANCYITKTVGLGEFTKIVEAPDHVWFTVVMLPRRPKNGH